MEKAKMFLIVTMVLLLGLFILTSSAWCQKITITHDKLKEAKAVFDDPRPILKALPMNKLIPPEYYSKMTHDMEPLIRNARTKADHEALAAHYEEEAKALEGKAAEHERFAQVYAGQLDSPRVKLNQPQHCRNLAAKYREAAAENLELAKEHHQLAEAAPK